MTAHEAIREAARILREGGVVSFPTETVYGLGANALDPKAVARIFELKGRPRFDPLIVHVPSLEAAEALSLGLPRKARLLAERFWPGPLTLVVDKAESIPEIVTSGLPRVGLRVPAHPVALALLRETGLPLAAPSANPFGKVSPTQAAHVQAAFGDLVPVLDGGACACGVESTVIQVASDDEPAVLLRPGGLSLEAIREVVGEVLIGDEERALRPPAPGMLAHHYGTETRLLLDPSEMPTGRVGWLGIGMPDQPERFALCESLSRSGDLQEAAANLFSAMRKLDACELDALWVQSVPDEGLGRAINDRLRRASAPKH